MTNTGPTNFGNFEQTSIHVYEFNDLNGNGVDNSEPRLAGWTIVLTGTNGQDHTVSATTFASVNGVYSSRLHRGHTGERAATDRLVANGRQGNVHAHQRFQEYQPGTDFIRWACQIAR